MPLGGAAPDSPGYDLLGAVVGSEGTLGIVTSTTVRLVRLPEEVRTILVGFESTDQAGAATSAIISAGIVPAAIEMMDALAIEAAEAAVQCNYPDGAGAVLVIELDGAAVEVEQEYDEVERLCTENGAFEQRLATDPAERALIWKGRKSAFAAVGRISPDYIVQDGVIPRTALPEVLKAIADAVRRRPASGSPTSSTPATATCTRWCSSTTPSRAPARRPRRSAARSSTSASSTAARSPASTASAWTRRSTCRGCTPTTTSTPCSWCAAPSTRTNISNPGKVFPTPRLCGEVPGRHKGAHPLQEAGLAEVF